MSKSKRNVVDPSEIIATYGADTERLYTMFMGPPDRDIDWSDEGIRGSSRFLNRVWSLIIGNVYRLGEIGATSNPAALDPAGLAVWRRYHRTVKKVTEDIEDRFAFNTAVAAIMELVNELVPYAGGEPDPALLRDTIDGLVLLLSPFTPFVCEELWRRTGHEDAVLDQTWPGYDQSALEEETIEIPVQVNGKLRARVTVPADVAENAEALKKAALAHERIQANLEGKEIVKVIAVPGKMVSLVVK